jgi:hypothetical protein
MPKITKFLLGGIVLLALTKLPYLKEQTFDLAALIGLIVGGSILGSIGYLIFGRKKDKK